MAAKTTLKAEKYQDLDDDLSAQDYVDLLISFTNNALIFSDLLIVNIQQLAGNKVAFIEYLYQYRNNFIDMAIWDKINPPPAMKENVFNSRFEYLVFLTMEDMPTRTIPNSNFRGTLDNIYTADRLMDYESNGSHTASFPMHLPEYAISNFAQGKNKNILDPFGGTGTTLLAAEKLGYRCYMMEISPAYCDVIIQRWQNATNKKAERLL